ncbi:MAG: regulator of chromosome condensation [Acidimicrobiales bacterium]|nr:regulator of chromosome condensation [Acidimicrobiales bacterium]
MQHRKFRKGFRAVLVTALVGSLGVGGLVAQPASADTVSIRSVDPAVGTTSAPAATFVRGQKVVVTFTVTKRVKTVQPTGTVTLTIDGGATFNVALKSTGKATYSSTTLPLGERTVSGHYNGDSRYAAGSTGSATFTVIKGSTTATIKSTLEPVPSGALTRVTGQARRVAPATGSLAGSITFSAFNGTDAPTVATLPSTATGIANWKVRLANGTWLITATNNGNADFDPSATSAPVTVHVGPPAPAALPTSITGGENHTCAAYDDGTARCWGLNDRGQLGDGTTVNSNIPVVVSGLTGVTSITAGAMHTCATLSDATARCWGFNNEGQLGDGTMDDSAVPIAVNGVSGVTSLTAGAAHTCATLADTTTRCWGYNSLGQLGDGTNDTSTTAVIVADVVGATALAAGPFHTCAVLGDGTAKCWGYNSHGALGDGTNNTSYVAVDVVGLSGIVSIDAGAAHTCAVLSDHSAHCWGHNGNGQLGDGTLDFSNQPVAVSGLGSTTAIVVDGFHTCALAGRGGAACWGLNNYGQLGDGTNVQSPEPLAVPGLGNVRALAAGYNHNCALDADGTIACWGRSEFGQLGTPPPAM